MSITCPKCGNEVRDGAPYCDLCHGLLEQGGRSGLSGSPAGPLPPVSPVALRGTRVERAEGGGEVWAPPPPVYQQRAAGMGTESYQRRMLIATAVLGAAGILVVCCTFMPWMGLDLGLGFKVDLSGWQIWRELGGAGGNPFYLRIAGISVFTGLCSLIGGILMAGLAGALFVWRRMELAYAIFPVTLLMLGISIINTFNIMKIGFGLGFGTIIFLAASIAGIAAGVFIRQSLSR